MLCARQGEHYADKAKRPWTEEAPGAASGWAGASRAHMVFGQILYVLGEVKGLENASGGPTARAKAWKWEGLQFLLKYKNESGEQRLWQEILGAPGEAYYGAWAWCSQPEFPKIGSLRTNPLRCTQKELQGKKNEKVLNITPSPFGDLPGLFVSYVFWEFLR